MEPEKTPEQARDAEHARQGEIILRRRWSRIVFIGALVGVVILAVLFRIAQ